MKQIQEKFLLFIESESDEQNYFQNIIQCLNDLQIRSNKNYLKAVLHLISKIINHHHRSFNFFTKVEQILKIFQNDYQTYFTNYDIFNIFKSNKRILLFLFEEKIIFPDESFYLIFVNEGKFIGRFYLGYFYPEFKFLIDKYKIEISKDILNMINSETFLTKRKNGENEEEITELIRNDSIDDFILYINKNQIPLSKIIHLSLFETNSFLTNRLPTLIEYAAFHGSVNIFLYLYKNVELKESIWLYAIHGNNDVIIDILLQSSIQPQNNAFIECCKCNHIKMLEKIQSKISFTKDDIKENFLYFLKYYNFISLDDQIKQHNNVFDQYIKSPNDQICRLFYFLCKYDYMIIIDSLLNHTMININEKISFTTLINQDLQLLDQLYLYKVYHIEDNQKNKQQINQQYKNINDVRDQYLNLRPKPLYDNLKLQDFLIKDTDII